MYSSTIRAGPYAVHRGGPLLTAVEPPDPGQEASMISNARDFRNRER